MFARLTALALCLLLPSLALAEPAEAELPTLSKLVIVSGEATLTGALPSLTPEAKLIAANFEGSSAATDRSTLVVGVKSSEPVGTVLSRIEFRSDCPNNSVFYSQDQVTGISPETIKRALATWTRIRHKAERAPVQEIVDFAVYDGYRWDVRLDLRSVSSR
jgi:hypothetical protein